MGSMNLNRLPHVMWLALAVAFAWAAALPQEGCAYVPLTYSAGPSSPTVKAVWNLSSYPSGIPFVLRTDAAGDGTSDLPGATELDAIRKGFQNWTDVAASAIAYRDLGITKRLIPGALDGTNVAGFASDDLLSRAGVVALALPTLLTGASGGQAGQIVETDILFLDDPSIQWKSAGRNHLATSPGGPNEINLEEIATREIGHFNGLNNNLVRFPYDRPLFVLQDGVIIHDNRLDSFQTTCLMYPFVMEGSPAQNVAVGGAMVTDDEKAGVSALYPAPSYSQQYGGIGGRITLRDTVKSATSELCGACVLAVRPGGLRPVASAISGPDGSYRIKGLEAGDYLIWVEPSSPADLQGLYEQFTDASLEFLPEFYNNTYYSDAAKANLVAVHAGGITGQIDVEVVKLVRDRETTYARGPQTDPEGQPLVLKIEPDNFLDEATHLQDDNQDGIIVVDDVIQSSGDSDFYTFRAKRDDVYSVEVVAARDGSQLDPVLNLFGPGIQAVPFATADNTPGLGNDARIVFTAPEVDNYYVEVSNAGPGGGGSYFYTLVIKRLSGRVPVTPLGGPVAVASIPISDVSLEAAGFTNPTFGHIEILEIKVQFLDVDGDGGLNTDGSDFLPPTRESNGGIGGVESGFILFVDDGSVPGKFDYDPANPNQAVQDSSIRLRQAPTIQSFGFGFEVTFIPDEPLLLPAAVFADNVPDFHIVIQPSLTLHHGDDFQVIIPQNGIRVRNNADPGLPEATLFSQDYPAPEFRDKFTGDIVELTTFLPHNGGLIEVPSVDYPVAGLNLIGDPNEEYWISQVTLSFVGYSFQNLIRIVPSFQEVWQFFNHPDPTFRTWEPTDLAPLFNGVSQSGGVSLWEDNDIIGAIGDGIPNFGLDGDFRLALAGNQRFEVVPVDTVPDDVIKDLFPHALLLFTQLSSLLAQRNQLNLFAFKAILPLQPQASLRVPDSESSTKGTLGPDMFIALRTSFTAYARDVFVPYIQVDDVRVSNNLAEVILHSDPGRSTLVNGGSLRSIDPTTQPNTTLVEVRPGASTEFQDKVTPDDPHNRGNVIGSLEQGSPPLGVIGIDAQDFGQSAMCTPNAEGVSFRDIINSGEVLNSLRILIDPVNNNPPALPLHYLLNVTETPEGSLDNGALAAGTIIDPNLIDLPLRGVDIIVDDDTPEGDFIDNDNDGLTDEELVNDNDDDLDGITDESDFGDEDAVGLNGQVDPNDDTLAYLQANDFLNFGHGTSFLGTPTVTRLNTGSLQVDFPDLRTFVFHERRFIEDIFADPLSVFINGVFVRIDHPLITTDPGEPAAFNIDGDAQFDADLVGPVYQHGYILILDPAVLVPGIDTDYYYLQDIPNSNRIHELEGSDFFVTLRMGPDAITGQTFRARIPTDGFHFSLYRDSNVFSQNIQPRTAPPQDFNTFQIRVGSNNVPPTLSFVTPNNQNNQAGPVLNPKTKRVTFQFDVNFLFSDPDNTATVDFYYDDNNFGVDGKAITPVTGEITSNIRDNDGARPLTFKFEFPPDVANRQNASVFIYGIVTDDVNPARAVYSNAPIVLSATSRAELSLEEFIIADNLGQIFGTGGANINIPEYRQRTNSIRDIALTPDERGALFLTSFGDVVLRGDPDPWADFVRLSDSVTFPEGGSLNFGMDLARDIEPDWRRKRYFLLDGHGGVHRIGSASGEFDLSSVPPSMDDIYRDMEITPTGLGLEVMDGFGHITPLGDGLNLGGANFGMDIARDFALSPGGNGAYILDAYGGLQTVGDATVFEPTQVPFFPGSDIYRSVKVVPGGDGLLILDREGQVFPVGNVRLGPNPVPAGVITTPPGINPGDPIVFTPPDNVVTGELGGAFIDLEISQTSEVPQRTIDRIRATLDGLCSAIAHEDLARMLTFLTDGFVDEQGHHKDDFAAVWKAFFDQFRTVTCFFEPGGSLNVTRTSDAAETYIVSIIMEVVTLDPILRVLAPADDPTTLEPANSTNPINGGELFNFGPVLIDQAVRFWETDDGRGWRMRIISDDNIEGQLDRADRILTERYFTKSSSRTRHEGDGFVFFQEGDQLARSHSGNYIVQFVEQVEGQANSSAGPGGPTGGWNQPVVYSLWFNPPSTGGGTGGTTAGIPISTFRNIVSFKVAIDPITRAAKIIGGSNAVFAMLSVQLDPLGPVTQNASLDAEVTSPVGWRFFNPLGVITDAGRDFVYDSHLIATGRDTPEMIVPAVLTVPDQDSSAYLVNLTDASNFLELPPGSLPLKSDLRFPRQDIANPVFPDFSLFKKQITVFPGDYVLLTFRADEQPGVTDRLIYATLQIQAESFGGFDSNTFKNLVFTWRYKPDEDFITDFIPFK